MGEMLEEEAGEEEKRPEVLEAQLHELENSIEKLKESNAAIATALEESPEDEDFRQALDENTTIIRRREELAADLRRMIEDVMGVSIPQHTSGSVTEAPAAPEPTSEAGLFL